MAEKKSSWLTWLVGGGLLYLAYKEGWINSILTSFGVSTGNVAPMTSPGIVPKPTPSPTTIPGGSPGPLPAQYSLGDTISAVPGQPLPTNIPAGSTWYAPPTGAQPIMGSAITYTLVDSSTIQPIDPRSIL